jgi:F-type H+-transporting ATPase subunit delta
MSNVKGETSFEASFDVRSQQVARVYAEALIHAAQKTGKVDPILEQLSTLVHDIFESQPLLEKYLGSGAIRRDVKRSAIERAFDGKADPLLIDFLQVLNNHERLDLVRAVWSCYRELHDRLSSRMRVKVRVAAPLTNEQEQQLKQELHDYFKLEPVLDIRVLPDLLGGMTVQVGDWVFDGTVKARLERLRNQLMAGANYVQDRRDQFSTAS